MTTSDSTGDEEKDKIIIDVDSVLDRAFGVALGTVVGVTVTKLIEDE